MLPGHIANVVRIGLAVPLVFLLLGGVSWSTEIRQPTGVVEMFTSQGCSSCPPADRVLAELARSDDTLALAWHVDYWDYLGWQDTFASASNTSRQRAYARTLSRQNIYTPQAIINGRTDVVGSRGTSVTRTLARFAGTQNGLTVPIHARIDANRLRIQIDPSPDARDATLWMVYMDAEREVPIKRGENGGRTLRYTNIVQKLEMIGMVHEKGLQAEFALQDISRRGHDLCALILQRKTRQGTPGPIVGAAIIRDL